MAKRCALLLTIIAFILLAPGASAGAETTTTILVYMCGGDLETEDYSGSRDLREMTRASLDPDGPVTVLVEVGGAQTWRYSGVDDGVNQRFLTTADGLIPVGGSLGARNMGEAATLADFVAFGIANYPADRYALVLWDHGGGPIDGACYDELFGDDALTLREMASALGEALPDGLKLDILGFDACLMGNFETAYALKDYCDYYIGSEESSPGSGWDYDECLRRLAANPDMSSGDLAKMIAETHVADNSRARHADTATMSVLSGARLDAVAEALDAFGAALEEILASGRTAELIAARDSTISFGEIIDSEATDLIDIFALCDAFSAYAPNEAEALRAAAEEAVVFSAATEDIADYARGFSVLLPYDTLSRYREIVAVYERFDYMPGYVSFVTRFMSEARGSLSAGHAGEGLTSGYDFGDLWAGLEGAPAAVPEPSAAPAPAELPPYAGFWDGLTSATPAPAPASELPPYVGLWDGFGL